LERVAFNQCFYINALVKPHQQQGFERGRKNCSCPSNQFPAIEDIGIDRDFSSSETGKREFCRLTGTVQSLEESFVTGNG